MVLGSPRFAGGRRDIGAVPPKCQSSKPKILEKEPGGTCLDATQLNDQAGDDAAKHEDGGDDAEDFEPLPTFFR